MLELENTTIEGGENNTSLRKPITSKLFACGPDLLYCSGAVRPRARHGVGLGARFGRAHDVYLVPATGQWHVQPIEKTSARLYRTDHSALFESNRMDR